MQSYATRRAMFKTGALVLTGSAFIGTANARTRPRNFNTHLTSDAHDEPETNAQGQVNFQLRDGELRFKLIVANIDDVLMGHIHLDHVLGPVAVWLHDFDTGAPSLVEGRVNGVLAQGTITDDEIGGPIDTVDELVGEIDDENAWVNVHTEDFPGGEIGGLIRARN